MLLFSRQGKVRLQKWYSPLSLKEKKKIMRELIATILSRKSKMCNFLEYKETKVVYKRYLYTLYSNYLMRHFNYRYASLYFCCAVEQSDNELLSLEVIHRYVELLDKYFGSVSQHNTLHSLISFYHQHLKNYTLTI